MPPLSTTPTSSRAPVSVMVRVTVIGRLKPDLIWRVQIIQIFRCTPARYQSPAVSLPPGTPMPGGAWMSRPGTEAVPVPLLAVDAAEGAGVLAGGGVRVFLLSSAGRPFGSSFGGFRTFGGGSGGGGGAAGATTGGGATAAAGSGRGARGPPPPRGIVTANPETSRIRGARAPSHATRRARPR